MQFDAQHCEHLFKIQAQAANDSSYPLVLCKKATKGSIQLCNPRYGGGD